MFETANLQSGGRTANRSLSIAMSTTLQVAAAAAVLVYPLLRVEALPRVTLRREALRSPVMELVPVNTPRAAAQTAPAAMSAPTAAPRPAILPPRTIPSGVPALFDDAPPAFAASSSAPFSLDSGLSSGCIGDCAGVRPVPPPAAPSKPASKPTAAPPPQAPVPVGGDVRAPRLVYSVQPVYPPLARQARIQGAVRLQAVITREGIVRSLQLVSGHPLLAPAALDAVRQWRYDATRLNGVPIEIILQVDVNFTLAR